MLTTSYLLNVESGIKKVHADTIIEVKELLKVYNRLLLNVEVICFWYNSETNTSGKYVVKNI